MKLYPQVPGLCLCLFFLLVTVSCASRRTADVQVSPMMNSIHSAYQIKVTLQADGASDQLPGEYAKFLFYPMNVMYSRNYMATRPETLQLYFRFPDRNLMRQCLDRLLSTGDVIQITTIKY